MSAIDPAVLAEWRAAIGRNETRRERLETESLRRYALAVGAKPEVETVPPPLAHWAFFLPRATDVELDEDGHLRRGGFLPAITLPSRMFAAAKMSFEAPLLLDNAAHQISSIAEVAHKSGRSGDLVFVEIDRLLVQHGEVRVRERQSYVYRGAGDAAPMPRPRAEPIEGEAWQPGPINLFRFSAATFNTHRIHYDAPYAREVELYPDLVVHGPFTAAKLAELAGRAGALASFAFRAQAPLFCGQPIRLQSGRDELRAVRCDGTVAMTAKATYR